MYSSVLGAGILLVAVLLARFGRGSQHHSKMQD